jgi:hypothetical protein
MLNLEYKDFNEAYIQLNRLILQKPHLVEYLNTTMGGLDNIFLTIQSSTCDKIDLGALGYKKQKWAHLVRTYLGNRVSELSSLGLKVKGLSAGFDFNRKETGNGSCLREILISRRKRNKPWDTITVVWRTTELQRRWAADLIFVHRIMELIPNSNFTKVQLYMNTAYQSAMYIIPLVKPIFGLNIADLDPKHFYTNVIITREKKYYKPLAKDQPHKLLASGQKIVDLYKQYESGTKLEKLDYKSCKLGV